MLRRPGERGERGLAIFLESLKLPAAVGMKVRDVSQSLRGGSGEREWGEGVWGSGGREWGEGTINQVAFGPQVLSSKKNKKKKQGFSSPNFLRKESGSYSNTYQQQGSRILAKGAS